MQLILIYDHIELGTQIEYFDRVKLATTRHDELIQLEAVTSITMYQAKTITTFNRSAELPYDDHKVVYNIIS